MPVIEGREGEELDGDEAGAEGEPLETEQLALTEEDDRLPWLESPEDEDYDDSGSDNGGMVKLLVGGLLALAVLIGGIWWATHRNPDPALVADGSLVPAEPGSYKEAPKNPGGKQFDGTGDSSFAVSEGQNRPAKLGGADKAPAAAKADANAKPGVSTGPAASAGGVGVQVGAFSSKAAAEAGWSKLVAQANGTLSGVSHRVIEGTADNGTIYRLQAVAGDGAAANALCGRLKAASIPCQVK
jgi:hypothetical protein